MFSVNNFVVLIFAVILFRLASPLLPTTSCGNSKEIIQGPLCFLYYNCSIPGDKKLVICQNSSVFNPQSKRCESNNTQYLACLDSLKESPVYNYTLNFIKSYLNRPDLSDTILSGDKNNFSSIDHPCADTGRQLCLYDSEDYCIIPFPDCSGFYNCSNPFTYKICDSNKSFDKKSLKCQEPKFANCDSDSIYPPGINHFVDIRQCSPDEIRSCNFTDTKIDCIFIVNGCMEYFDCLVEPGQRHVRCSDNRNERSEHICYLLLQSKCHIPIETTHISDKTLPPITILSSTPASESLPVDISTRNLVYKVGETAKIICKSSYFAGKINYIWFVNEVILVPSKRINISTNNSQSTLIFNPVSESESGQITCQFTYGGDLFAESRSIWIRVYRPPVVRITPTALAVEQHNEESTFSCNVTVQNSNITFQSDTLLHINWYINGTIINHTGQILTINLKQSTGIKCCANMSQTGVTYSNECLVTFFTSQDMAESCKREILSDLTWETTKAGKESSQPCFNLKKGNVIRICFPNGTWDRMNIDECLLNEVKDLELKLDGMDPSTFTSADLTTFTEDLPKNINESRSDDIITRMAKVLYQICILRNKSNWGNVPSAQTETTNVLDSAGGILQSPAWKKLNSTKTTTPLQLVRLLNVYLSHPWPPEHFYYSYNYSDMLVFERKTSNMRTSEVVFPTISTLHRNTIKVFNKALNGYADSYFSAGGSLMKGIAKDLISRNNNSVINSELISMDILLPELPPSFNETLVEFTLEHLQVLHNYKPSCVFWNFKEPLNGFWSNIGCKVEYSDDSYTTCQCNHLTNFAILFSPFPASEKDSAILSIISLIGCIISIITLFLTIALYITKWKILKSKRTVFLINLCISLIIANIVFLAGVDQTSDAGGCTAVAALLHYLFLVSFFMMLMIALHLFISIFFVFFVFTRKKIVALTILGWFLPMVIVAISLGVTRLKGYGNDENCWLSIENGLLWAFVGPAVAILFFNLVIATSVLIRILRLRISYQKKEKSKLLSAARNLIVLTPILGFTWVFGVLSVNQDLVVFQYIFAVANSLQGLFIFLLHGLFFKKNLSSQKKKDQSDLPEKFPSSTQSRLDLARRSQGWEGNSIGQKPLALGEKGMRNEDSFVYSNDTAPPYSNSNFYKASIRNQISVESSTTDATNL